MKIWLGTVWNFLKVLLNTVWGCIVIQKNHSTIVLLIGLGILDKTGLIKLAKLLGFFMYRFFSSWNQWLTKRKRLLSSAF